MRESVNGYGRLLYAEKENTRERSVPDGSDNHHHWQLEGVCLLCLLTILTVQQRNDLFWPQRNVDSEIRVAVIISILNYRPCCHITIVITITIIIIDSGLSGSSLFTHKIDQRPQSSSYRRRYNSHRHRHQQFAQYHCYEYPNKWSAFYKGASLSDSVTTKTGVWCSGEG